jgi:hypothetical protein
MCGKTHLFTESSCVAFTTQVCFIADMCGNNQICVRKPHRDVLGFFHTCVVKHTHGLISPWNHGVSYYSPYIVIQIFNHYIKHVILERLSFYLKKIKFKKISLSLLPGRWAIFRAF